MYVEALSMKPVLETFTMQIAFQALPSGSKPVCTNRKLIEQYKFKFTKEVHYKFVT